MKVKNEPKIKWWKLRGVEGEENFRELVREKIGEDANQLPEDWVKTAELLRKTAREVLGVTTGQRTEDKETWWWNESVQECVKKKREAKKNWDRLQNEASKKWYEEMREATKREVARAKEHAYEELYDKLETEVGQKELYRLAKQRERAGKDVQLVKVIKDENGVLLSSEEDVRQR